MAPSTRSPRSTRPAETTRTEHPDDSDEIIDLTDIDEIVDLTDRRRVLLLTLFGVAVPPNAADAVFDGATIR